jgi:hypothetical protein
MTSNWFELHDYIQPGIRAPETHSERDTALKHTQDDPAEGELRARHRRDAYAWQDAQAIIATYGASLTTEDVVTAARAASKATAIAALSAPGTRAAPHIDGGVRECQRQLVLDKPSPASPAKPQP